MEKPLRKSADENYFVKRLQVVKMKVILTWAFCFFGILTLAGISSGFVHSFRRLKPTFDEYEVIHY